MSASSFSIDRDTFAFFVHAWRTRLKMTDRQAADDAGVSASAICRAESKRHVDTATYLALCLWMGAEPYAFLIDPRTGKRIPSNRAPVSRGTHTETAESRAE